MVVVNIAIVIPYCVNGFVEYDIVKFGFNSPNCKISVDAGVVVNVKAITLLSSGPYVIT